jgi:L-ribulose-5-phosphate 3-epimerase
MNRRQLLAGGAALWAARAQAAPTLKSRLGITSDEISPDLEKALKFLREFGLGWVEIRNLWGKYVTEQPLAEIKRARTLMDAQGVKLSVLDTALFKCNLPGTTSSRKEDYPYAEQEALLGRALERAPLLGTRFLRVFTFWRADKDPQASWPRVLEHLGKAATRARAAGCTLLVENVNGANVETSAECARMLMALETPALGLAWDPNNARCGGEVPFPDGYRQLDHRRVHHLHLRDATWDAAQKKCQWLPVGKGEVDNLGILRALVKDRFAGTLTLETHWQRPDKNKELATRESLKGLLEVLEKAAT